MSKFFTVNEHPYERVARVLLGVGILSLAFIGPKTPLGYLGIIPILTGASGMCPLYSLLGINTCPARR
jgi:hypothetical protein